MNKKCILCKTNDVYAIKSHMTPAGIASGTFGKRHIEEIYTIDPNESTIDVYFGPQNKQTETTEIKPEPHTHRGIFCKKCEDNLALYESEVQTKLKAIIDNIGKGTEIKRTKSDTKYLELNIHPNILQTFFQSIIWRQCIDQVIKGKDSPLDESELEAIRVKILQCIYTNPKEITENLFTDNHRIALLCTYNKNDPNDATFINPHIYKTNPQLFFIGTILLLYWNKDEIDTDFEKKTQIPPEILESDLQLANGLLILINESQWEKIMKLLVKTTASIYNKSKHPK